ncbi:unnamed protein product [Periconia digitata]|uniref:Uncharacterized protein n=1 Tax=Periconia digitata TaxID=1303443 RepID=A0A9W4UT81_9PLEO|nr:unnamed protein product [Periconia digitata]
MIIVHLCNFNITTIVIVIIAIVYKAKWMPPPIGPLHNSAPKAKSCLVPYFSLVLRRHVTRSNMPHKPRIL